MVRLSILGLEVAEELMVVVLGLLRLVSARGLLKAICLLLCKNPPIRLMTDGRCLGAPPNDPTFKLPDATLGTDTCWTMGGGWGGAFSVPIPTDDLSPIATGK
jgi:hypothetical protein